MHSCACSCAGLNAGSCGMLWESDSRLIRPSPFEVKAAAHKRACIPFQMSHTHTHIYTLHLRCHAETHCP